MAGYERLRNVAIYIVFTAKCRKKRAGLRDLWGIVPLVLGVNTYHVAVSDGLRVYDMVRGGERVVSMERYNTEHPTISYWYRVQGKPLIYRTRAKYLRPISLVRSLARWLTRGRVESNDCVTRACELLREAGLDVPKNTVTPRQLKAWLDQRNTPHVWFPEAH
jgi:hypothetical protein